MGILFSLVKMVADEVCLIIRQCRPMTNRPIIDRGLEGKGISVGIVLSENFISGGVNKMLKF
jgi:hypothetical protein